MITAAIIDLLFIPLNLLCSLFPQMDIDISVDVLSKFFVVLEIVLYLLPTRAIVPIFIIIIGLNMFKVIISLIKSIWELIPFA